MSNLWLPRRGLLVVPSLQPSYPPVTLVRRLGRWDAGNEHWLGRSARGNVVTVAVGQCWVPWEGRR